MEAQQHTAVNVTFVGLINHRDQLFVNGYYLPPAVDFTSLHGFKRSIVKVDFSLFLEVRLHDAAGCTIEQPVVKPV